MSNIKMPSIKIQRPGQNRLVNVLAICPLLIDQTPAAPQRYKPSRLSPAPASPRSPLTRSAAARPASIAPSK